MGQVLGNSDCLVIPRNSQELKQAFFLSDRKKKKKREKGEDGQDHEHIGQTVGDL